MFEVDYSIVDLFLQFVNMLATAKSQNSKYFFFYFYRILGLFFKVTISHIQKGNYVNTYATFT